MRSRSVGDDRRRLKPCGYGRLKSHIKSPLKWTQKAAFFTGSKHHLRSAILIALLGLLAPAFAAHGQDGSPLPLKICLITRSRSTA